VVRASDIRPREVHWLWRGRIPRWRLTLLVGRPGDGKCFATVDWAARISTERPWPDGFPCELGSVLFETAEDDPEDTIRPRLDAHGADTEKVLFLRGVNDVRPDGERTEAMFTLANMPALEEALSGLEAPALCVIDPIGSFVGGRVDANKDNEVRSVLARLSLLAQKTNVAIVLVAHQRKSVAPHADDMVLGSRAFTSIARSVWHLLRDPNDDDRRLLLPGKSNMTRPMPGLAFRIVDEPARLEWEEGAVEATADGVLSEQFGRGAKKSSCTSEAEAWLEDVLSQGAIPASELKTSADAEGIKPRTLDRVKEKLGVIARREGFAGGRWVWDLPRTAPTSAKSAIHESVAHNDEIGAQRQADSVVPNDSGGHR
jgi:putative DNA primase/helicase